MLKRLLWRRSAKTVDPTAQSHYNLARVLPRKRFGFTQLFLIQTPYDAIVGVSALMDRLVMFTTRERERPLDEMDPPSMQFNLPHIRL